MKTDALAKIKVIAESLVPPEEKKDKASVTENQPSWVNQVAVLTGILAALTGFLTVRSTSLTNDAIYESNQAVLAQTEASDAWGEYQADSIKARIVEVQLTTPGLSAANKKKLAEDYNDLRTRQPQIKKEAEDKLVQRKDHLDKSLGRLGQRDLLGYAGMAAQLAIALASVAALTRRQQVFYVGVAVGVVSVLITAYVFAGSYFSGHL